MSSHHLLKVGGLFLVLVPPGQPTGDSSSHSHGLAGRRGEHSACQRARDSAHSTFQGCMQQGPGTVAVPSFPLKVLKNLQVQVFLGNF